MKTTSSITLERAKEITGKCNLHVMYREGLRDEKPPSINGHSLAELVEANRIVREAGGINCDDRFVAALYVAAHYEGGEEPAPIAYGEGGIVLVIPYPG